MKRVHIHQVDAFAQHIFGGNPAGVVTDASSLTPAEMQRIAREMNLSETAFVVPSKLPGAQARLRYFTPSTEIDFCGHATIGTLFELARADLYGLGRQGTHSICMENNVGTIQMSVEVGAKAIRTHFDAPKAHLQNYRLQGKEFAQAFGINPSSIRGMVLADTKLNYVYVPIGALDILGAIAFNQELIRQNFAADNIVAFCLYTPETFSSKAQLHVRVTCPLIGISEDPFTGSTLAGTILSAKKQGWVAASQKITTIEQGNFLGRGGFAKVTHDVATDAVRISAGAVHVFSTVMEF
ncbi:MAG TPA: PhzF family phenazine biosynthesis protein [Candidatus Saccharimonadales bacterium]|nr:PhzF family phenazine biosynthesis protein [Candidatus Saccharimonadales bacterium]